jgi:hypothetical protein
MKIDIIKIDKSSINSVKVFTLSIHLDHLIIKLQESLNNYNYQPLLIYSGESKKYKNINKKYGAKDPTNIDFSKIKENTILLNSSSIFIDYNPLQQLKNEEFRKFISSCKDNNINLILRAPAYDILNEMILIIDEYEIEIEYFNLKEKSDIDGLYKQIRRNLAFKYIDTFM